MSIEKIETCSAGKIKYNVVFDEEDSGEEFEIDDKYELTEGLWYTVCSAIDTTAAEKVAIKKIASEGRRAFREFQILRQFRHPFIIGLKDVILPADKDHFDHIFVVSELMQQNLEDYLQNISEDEKGQKRVSDFKVKLILNQVLRAVQYMHASGFLHRDIHPDNILMDGMRVKLCDFGDTIQKSNEMNRYRGAPGYSSPEYFLNPEKNCHEYGEVADVWALGCLFSCLLHPDQGLLFDLEYSSGSEFDNLHKISEVVRVPEYIEELYYFIEDAGMLLFAKENLPHTPKEPLAERFKDVEDKSAIDLLEKMLEFNPNKRISAEEALKHEYMADITVEVLARELNLNDSEVEELKNWNPCGGILDEGRSHEFREELYALCLSFKAGDNVVGDKTGDNAEDKGVDKTEDKTGGKTWHNAEEKEGNKTEDKIGDNAEDKVRDKSEDKTGDNAEDKGGDKTKDKTGGKTGDKTEDKTGDNAEDKVWDKSEDKTGDNLVHKVVDKTEDKQGIMQMMKKGINQMFLR